MSSRGESPSGSGRSFWTASRSGCTPARSVRTNGPDRKPLGRCRRAFVQERKQVRFRSGIVRSLQAEGRIMALLDQFGRSIEYLRISVTDRCNFRCRYCMPLEGLPWLPRSAILRYEEITEIV